MAFPTPIPEAYASNPTGLHPEPLGRLCALPTVDVLATSSSLDRAAAGDVSYSP